MPIMKKSKAKMDYTKELEPKSNNFVSYATRKIPLPFVIGQIVISYLHNDIITCTSKCQCLMTEWLRTGSDSSWLMEINSLKLEHLCFLVQRNATGDRAVFVNLWSRCNPATQGIPWWTLDRELVRHSKKLAHYRWYVQNAIRENGSQEEKDSLLDIWKWKGGGGRTAVIVQFDEKTKNEIIYTYVNTPKKNLNEAYWSRYRSAPFQLVVATFLTIKMVPLRSFFGFENRCCVEIEVRRRFLYWIGYDHLVDQRRGLSHPQTSMDWHPFYRSHDHKNYNNNNNTNKNQNTHKKTKEFSMPITFERTVSPRRWLREAFECLQKPYVRWPSLYRREFMDIDNSLYYGDLDSDLHQIELELGMPNKSGIGIRPTISTLRFKERYQSERIEMKHKKPEGIWNCIRVALELESCSHRPILEWRVRTNADLARRIFAIWIETYKNGW